MAELNEQLSLIGARDGINEWEIFGPPGTGKTTHTAKQVGLAVEKYGADQVLITSFSRAAAAELVGRDLPVDRNSIGTLHAHCYRALGRPKIAETCAKDWNEQYPQYAIAGTTDGTLDEPMTDVGPEARGDELLASASRWRNRLVPVDMWPPEAELHQFYAKWCEWKQSSGLMDFTDLLEQAAKDCRIAPGDPKVIFTDEAQDHTRLQLDLVRRWGSYAEYFVVVGDDDQTIYTFTGATPDAFLRSGVPAEQKIVLSQSYRVPQAVHALATRWIERVTERQPKEYRPTREVGEVVRFEATATAPATFNRPGRIIDAAEREIAAGRTVMFLSSCSYMLAPLRRELAARGIPFHNPYRRKRGDWNPLFAARGTTAAERLLAFIKPHNAMAEHSQPWTAADFQKWADWLLAERTFERGGKTAAKSMQDSDIVGLQQLSEWMRPEAYAPLMDGIMNGPLRDHLFWWRDRVLQAHAKTAGYPIQVALNHGIEALKARPKAIIGTIHSVKGGESDVVYLFPDISRAAWGEWSRGGEFRDSIIRQFYVGMTRARHKLVICAPTGPMAVKL